MIRYRRKLYPNHTFCILFIQHELYVLFFLKYKKICPDRNVIREQFKKILDTPLLADHQSTAPGLQSMVQGL